MLKNLKIGTQIGLGFSVAQAPDIRAGGGQDEVRYNINAPVSVEGGTGFDKLVILGTEFADDFIRVHRNALVSIAHIRQLLRDDEGGWFLELDGVELCPVVSRRHFQTASQPEHARRDSAPLDLVLALPMSKSGLTGLQSLMN